MGSRAAQEDFYSRPCGRGDSRRLASMCRWSLFLLTPLREGRQSELRLRKGLDAHFYSRPCGRGDAAVRSCWRTSGPFLLTPLREGRQQSLLRHLQKAARFLLTPLREGRLAQPQQPVRLSP